MKVLFINGDEDYDALTFEDSNKGRNVGEIIRELVKSPHLIIEDDDGEQFEMHFEIKEFDIDPVTNMEGIKKFCDFIRNDVMDYDMGKSCNFYLETEVIED